MNVSSRDILDGTSTEGSGQTTFEAKRACYIHVAAGASGLRCGRDSW